MEPNTDYTPLLKVCEAAARAGGKPLVQMLGEVDVREKGLHDLQTDADLAAEQAVCATIREHFPDHQIVCEETNPDTAGPQSEYRWIVDPLDGTTNFAHGVPFFSVSVALQKNGETIVGTILNPMLNECYTAALGAGAQLNGRAIHASSVTDISNALVAFGLPPAVNLELPDLKIFLAVAPLCQAARRTGSAALNLCYVAAGRYDMYWTYSTKIWDIAAGMLIAQEAGATVTGIDGRRHDGNSGFCLAAATPQLHRTLQDIAHRTCPDTSGLET